MAYVASVMLILLPQIGLAVIETLEAADLLIFTPTCSFRLQRGGCFNFNAKLQFFFLTWTAFGDFPESWNLK